MEHCIYAYVSKTLQHMALHESSVDMQMMTRRVLNDNETDYEPPSPPSEPSSPPPPAPTSPAPVDANITFPTCTANISGATYTPFDAVCCTMKNDTLVKRLHTAHGMAFRSTWRQ